MDRDHRNDPYTSGKDDDGGLGIDSQTVLRYGAAAMGAILIMTGLMLAVSVFGVVRDIIESPDTFVTNLNGWTNADAAAAPEPEIAPPAPTVTPPAQTTPVEPVPAAPETPAPATEPETVDAKPGENAGPTTPDLSRIMESRDNEPIRPTTSDADVGNFLDEVLDMIRQGGMGRIAGGIFILLFTAMLVRIPLMLITVGVKLLSATAKVKMPGAK